MWDLPRPRADPIAPALTGGSYHSATRGQVPYLPLNSGMSLKGVTSIHLANDASQFTQWCLLGCADKLGKTGQTRACPSFPWSTAGSGGGGEARWEPRTSYSPDFLLCHSWDANEPWLWLYFFSLFPPCLSMSLFCSRKQLMCSGSDNCSHKLNSVEQNTCWNIGNSVGLISPEVVF